MVQKDITDWDISEGILMLKFILKLLKKLKPRTTEQIEYDYLASSHDLVDLERRQRVLQRRETTVNHNLKGWV